MSFRCGIVVCNTYEWNSGVSKKVKVERKIECFFFLDEKSFNVILMRLGVTFSDIAQLIYLVPIIY